MASAKVTKPHLTFGEFILRKLEKYSEEIAINGRVVNNIHYANDTTVLADSEEGLRKLLDQTLAASAKHGLKINPKKTKCIVISKIVPEQKRQSYLRW